MDDCCEPCGCCSLPCLALVVTSLGQTMYDVIFQPILVSYLTVMFPSCAAAPVATVFSVGSLSHCMMPFVRPHSRMNELRLLIM